MRDILGEHLKFVKKIRIRKKRLLAAVLALSLIVSLDVFWVLRQPGWALAGDASCGIQEHAHGADCATPCPLTEHTHSITCYSDTTANVETALDWQALFNHYPYTGDLRKDLVGIAQTQVGYTESASNFEVGPDGVRRGYNRYGAWYGAPYNDWSAAFVSFCLHYAGADPQQAPGNIGAASMAQLWKQRGKYAARSDYTPVAGDLVFFTNNTVGIVVEVFNASFYVIRGNIDDAVRGTLLSLADASIDGWGSTEGTITNKSLHDPALFDISNGPAFFIFTEGQEPPRMRRSAAQSRTTVTELIPYITHRGGKYYFTLLNMENRELPKDVNGNYIADAGTDYKLTLTVFNPEGFLPGTYQYQIPNGWLVNGGNGNFILVDGTNIGTWVVTDEGLVTMEFNELINSRTDITISATMGMIFEPEDEPLDFDGKITVTVDVPQDSETSTEIQKFGVQGDPNYEYLPNGDNRQGKTDSSKIYWTISINGSTTSQIPGNVISDTILYDTYLSEHRYSESDMAAGITIGAVQWDPVTGEELYWHSWTVYPGDPNLIWTENGWSYTMPEIGPCQYCGHAQLGNENFTYYIEYTTTPTPSDITGNLNYMNHVSVNHIGFSGNASFAFNKSPATINKTGSLISDAEGGRFLWEVQALIPGHIASSEVVREWWLRDDMGIFSPNKTPVYNDITHATVTAVHNGTTITVPYIWYATENDPFAWQVYWTEDNNGVTNVANIYIVGRCQCTEDCCNRWENGGCYYQHGYVGEYGEWVYPSGYCLCWTEPHDVLFTFTYETDGLDIIDEYGGTDSRLQNYAWLKYNGGIDAAETSASVTIPGIFSKTSKPNLDGYIAHYNITLNEAKLVLTDGSPITIHDVMTQTLSFVRGSLFITAEDAVGNTYQLHEGVDYTYEYRIVDEHGNNIIDEYGNAVHVLDVVIQNPQPVKYTLDYDAMLVLVPGTAPPVKYSNYATVTLWGQSVSDGVAERVLADFSIAAQTYSIQLMKTAAHNGDPLPGATFGLYNESGNLIIEATTDENGYLQFVTDIMNGVILREHVLYYLQELRAPPGYRLDNTKYWFCFCNSPQGTCTAYEDFIKGKAEELHLTTEPLRIPFEQVGKITAENELLVYNLPATGGPGVYPSVLVGMIFIIIPLVYVFIRRRKQERRGIG